MSSYPENVATIESLDEAVRLTWNGVHGGHTTWAQYKKANSHDTSPMQTLLVNHAIALDRINDRKPVDPIEAALDAVFQDWRIEGPDKPRWAATFKALCRKHFAGLTFPEAG